MNIAFHIPTWLLWVVGVPVVAFILICAFFGFVLLRDMSKGAYF